MNKFRETYRKASEELPKYIVSAERVQDELHHRKMKRQVRKYWIAKCSMAATVFLLCGAGTVAAKNYRDSVIRVNDTGVTITKQQNMDDSSHFLKIGGVFSTEDDIPEDDVIVFEPEIVEYDSFAKFMAEENVTVADLGRAFPDSYFTSERVFVMDWGREVHIDLSNEQVSFSLLQFDNRDAESYSSSISYMGQSDNVRNMTNSQGLNYVVFDTLDESGHVETVHAVISLNGRDLAFTFRGFEEREIEKILENLDLTIYFQE